MKDRESTIMIPRMLGVDELQSYLSLGRTRAVEFAKGCGASKRIGKRLLFDRVILDHALDQLEGE